jgi:hypothetical protein
VIGEPIDEDSILIPQRGGHCLTLDTCHAVHDRRTLDDDETADDEQAKERRGEDRQAAQSG